MSSFRIRPRFEKSTPLSPEEIQERIQKALSVPNARCRGKMIPRFITLFIPVEERHYWSPQLTINMWEEEDGTTLLRGLYGPSPSVWSLFVYSYAAIGILFTFIGIIGYSQWSLDQDAKILWALPALALAALVLYFVAQTGQKIGAAQTFTLHHFFEEALEDRVEIH
jgi:hypothetical protein